MNGKRVLIVDDAMDIGRMITAALLTLDSTIQIRATPSAEEAFLELSQDPPDLLIIDIRLPGISGLDLTRKIRSRSPAVKIIQISGLNEAQVQPRALEAGADAFFQKPLSMGDFLNTASRLLGKQAAPAPEPMPLEASADGQASRLADILTGLRRAVNAVGVGLINERGNVVGQTGDLSDPAIEADLIPALMAALSAGEKVSRQLGQDEPEYVYTFRGGAYHVLAAPVRGDYAVLALLQPEKSSLRMAIALEEVLAVRQELDRYFASSRKTDQLERDTAAPAIPAAPIPHPDPVPAAVLPVPVPPPGSTEKPATDKLELLIRATESGNLKPDEIDAFWEDLVAQEGSETSSNPDMLSYDQATRLGLTPKDTDL